MVGRGKTPTVQVAVDSSRMETSHVCTLKCASWHKETPPAQVTDNAQCKSSEVFALIDGRKTPPVQVEEGQDHLGH